MKFETPGYHNTLDTYIAYGYAESLIRAGAKQLTLNPLGTQYEIRAKNFTDNLNKGIINALEDMLSLHKAVGRYSSAKTRRQEGTESLIDFSMGVNTEWTHWKGTPKKLEAIKDKLKKGGVLSNSENETAIIQLLPTAGKYLPKHFGVKGGNPIKMTEVEFALAWIGFHYYVPYIKTSTKKTDYTHFYPLKPLTPLNLLEVLALKDLKTKVGTYFRTGNNFFTNKKLAMLYYLAHVESIGVLETVMGKPITTLSYTVEQSGNTKAIRSFGEYDVSRLMDFLSRLKRVDPFHTVLLIEQLTGHDLEFALAFVDGILYNDLDCIYNAIRGLRRNKVKIQPKVTNAILNWFS